MAFGVLYTASFKDRLSVNSFRIDILQEDYVSGSTSITYMGVTPVVLKYHSAKGEEQYIQGSSLTFRFKSLIADNDKYDALFEGYEKEFKIKYYDITSGTVLLWEGFIQSDNLSRSLTDNIYEITLNASDWLSNLKEVEFKNGDASFTDNVTVLSAIKTCLEFTGIELDFWVQLNTYETTYHTTISEVLKLTYIDLARFTKTENGKTTFTKVYDTLEWLIKSFNCTLKQVNGYYKIVNFYELSSFYFTFTWADFTASARTASPSAIAIDAYTITRNSNYTKLKPITRLDFKRNSNDIGGELVADTNDFTGTGPWTISAPDGYSQIDDRITITDNNPSTNDNHIVCSTASLTAVASKYIKLNFDIDYNVGQQEDPIEYSVVITKPSSGANTDNKITGTAPFHFESAIKDAYLIDESGVYTIKIQVSDSSQPYTSGTVAIYNVRITSVNVGDAEFDQNYIAYTDVDGQVTEDELYFSDANTNTDQGGFKAYSSGYVKTATWDRYGKTEDLTIHEIWAANRLKSRKNYKPLLTINIIDDSFNLSADVILQLDGEYYKITEIETTYNKSIHKIIMEFMETVDPSYTFSNTPLTTINGDTTETETPTGSGTSHSLLDGLSSDDHVQYYNITRGDGRYAGLAAANVFTAIQSVTIGGRIISIKGETISFDRAGTNYLWAETTGGDITFITNGLTQTTANGTLRLLGLVAIFNQALRARTTNGLDFQISTGSTYWKMENDGDFHAEGDVIAFSTTVSDKRLKDNIKPIRLALEKLCKIDGISFQYLGKDGKHFGIIAQDLKEIIPEVVIEKRLAIHKNDGKKYYVVRYNELIPYIIESIKDLFGRLKIIKVKVNDNDNEIKRLKHEINLLKKEVRG